MADNIKRRSFLAFSAAWMAMRRALGIAPTPAREPKVDPPAFAPGPKVEPLQPPDLSRPGPAKITFATNEDAAEWIRRLRGSAPELPEESEAIKRASVEKQVYIFNVGPIRFVQGCGSYGDVVIPALPERDCFGGTVAGPVIIPGLPSECCKQYANDSEYFERIYHLPTGSEYAHHPGLDFAMEVIGAARQTKQYYPGDLRRYGVFVSQSAEPSAEEIVEAQELLRKSAEEECAREDQIYRMEVDRHQVALASWIKRRESGESSAYGPRPVFFHRVDERARTFGRILKKTVSEHLWMVDA
jgi:hypothetical protein